MSTSPVTPVPMPQATQTRRPRRELPWLVSAGAAAVVLVVIVALLLVRPWAGGGVSVRDRLALVPGMSESGIASASLIDVGRLIDAAGAPLPQSRDEVAMRQWAEAAEDRVMGPEITPDARTQWRLFYEADAMVQSVGTDAGSIRYVQAFEGELTDKELTNALGEETDGVRQVEISERLAPMYFAQRDDVLYGAREVSGADEPGADLLPEQRPAFEDSMAADEQMVELLQTLWDEGCYSVGASRVPREVSPDVGISKLAGERAERVTMLAVGDRVRGGVPVMTLLFDHGSAADASENEAVIGDAIEVVLDAAGQPGRAELATEGSRVRATIALEAGERGLTETASGITVSLAQGSTVFFE